MVCAWCLAGEADRVGDAPCGVGVGRLAVLAQQRDQILARNLVEKLPRRLA